MTKYRVVFNNDENNFEEFEDLEQAIYFQENRGGRLKEVEVEEEVEEEIDAPLIPSKKSTKPKGEKMKKTLIATAAALTLMGCGGTGTGGDPVEYV
jgi:hypothetical protein